MKQRFIRRYAQHHENYQWEESFGDEKGRPRQQATQQADSPESFDSAAILQGMLKDSPTDATEPSLPPEQNPDNLPSAPLLPTMAQPEEKSEGQRPSGGSIQGLLQLAEEAETQARLTAEAAETANNLAQLLMDELQRSGDERLRQLGLTAAQNAFLAEDAAVQTQLAAMEAHAAAVNQSLSEMESVKRALHNHSQEFIQISRLAAQTQEEAELAREKSERARLEYAAKQNAALSSRDTMAQAKREYEAKLKLSRMAQENLELSQSKARHAHNEYLLLKEKLVDRRKQLQMIQQMQPAGSAPPMDLGASPPMPPPPPQAAPEQKIAPAQAAPEQTAPQQTAPEQTAPQPQIMPQPTMATPFVSPEQPGGALAELIPESVRQQIPALITPLTQLPAPEVTAPTAPMPEEDAAPVREAKGKKGFLRLYGRIFVIALVLALALRLFVIDVVVVEGTSMQPTLNNADSLISSKVAYMFSEPQRFDIILMDAPDGNGYYIKRVVGCPNERIQINEGRVFIDGRLLTESFLDGVETSGDINTVIPDGYYFVMGDNRPTSSDSRYDTMGPVAGEHIIGKAVMRIFPLNMMSLL